MTAELHPPPNLPPSLWVDRFAPMVPQGASVLDLACGGGRHARLFLGRGHPVTAIDRDLSRLEVARDAPGFTAIEADLEDGAPWPPGAARFGGIVVTNYLYRPLFDTLFAALEPGGVLIYETFAKGNERFGRPRNPVHLLDAGELLEAVRGHLRVVAYEDVEVGGKRPAMIQRICARAPGPER